MSLWQLQKHYIRFYGCKGYQLIYRPIYQATIKIFLKFLRFCWSTAILYTSILHEYFCPSIHITEIWYYISFLHVNNIWETRVEPRWFLKNIHSITLAKILVITTYKDIYTGSTRKSRNKSDIFQRRQHISAYCALYNHCS